MILRKRNQNSDCAIILTVHNHIEMFGFPCLHSVLKHSDGARVYVYDNESTDPEIENLRKLADSRSEVEFIRIDDQKTFGGLTGTWNDGIRRAREQGFSKVILLNHDVIVDNTWGNFIQAIESDFCIYGPLTNRPGGGPRDKELQMANRAEFQGLRNTRILMGFCMGFTLGRSELKLFDDWRFFNPELPFGGNEFDIQDRMKMRSTKAAFYIVTDSWVFHHLNKGWKDRPRYKDPHGPDNNIRDRDYSTQGERTSSTNYVTRFDDNNIFHILHSEILPLHNINPSELKKSNIYITENNINRSDLHQQWRLYVLSSIFCQAKYIKTSEYKKISDPVLLNTSDIYMNHDFIKCPPDAEYIRLTEFIKENTGTTVPEQDYVLLNQRPVGNRYLIESNSGLPLEEYLRNALGERGIPFRYCDFSTMTPTDQVQLCRGARIFISAHGAGCSNIIFTPLHCRVIEYNFRKYWNCHPVCDLHYHGTLADHEKCDSELTRHPYFHKADYHNLSRLLDRPYTELEVVRYEGYHAKNPICRDYMFVDGAELLAEIEQSIKPPNSKEKKSFNKIYTTIRKTYIDESINKLKRILYRVH